MADLKNFLNKHQVDVPGLSRIKHRLFVVGRFNRAEVDATNPPKIYLFTDRPDTETEMPAEYKELFDDIYGISFNNFVKALQPAIAEEVKRPGRIPMIVQHMPSQDSAEGGSVVIDTWNYFFWRAAANSTQEAFKPKVGAREQELLMSGEGQHGKSIYKQVRRNLNTLCRFQPMTPQLIDAFSELLGSTAMFNDLPPYASGDPLPGGFLEKLIDFLYCPDLNTDFSLDGLDLSDWEKVRNSKRSQQSMIHVVNTFRNVLVGSGDMHDLRIAGNVSLYQHAEKILSKKHGLTKGFEAARGAYNSLNQIIRSKVLLSMVMEWIFNAHYDLDPVVKLKADPSKRQADYDQLVSDLVGGKVKDPGIAPPILRATTEERDRFRTGLADNFEKLIFALLASDDKIEKFISELPEEIRSVAVSFRGNKDLRTMVQNMAMGAGDPRPFIESQKAVLIDVLLPVLYQTPRFELYELRAMFRREVQTAYLTAVTLDDKYQGVVREIAEEFLPAFLKNVDDQSRQIKNSTKMQSDLLRMYVERIANKDIAQRIVEAQEMISRAMTVMENTVVKAGETRGASHVAPYFSDDVRVTKYTQPSRRNQQAMVKLATDMVQVQRAEEKARETVSADGATKAASASMASSIGSAAAPSTGARPSAAPFPASSASTAGDGSSAKIPASLPAGEVSNPDAGQTTDGLREKVRAMLADFGKNSEMSAHESKDALRDLIESNHQLEKDASESVRIFHQILSVVYERYRENEGKQAFAGKVERMTLANMLLCNQEDIGLGKDCSNLYAMLLDSVENMDADNPDPRRFIKDFSLTRYFDNDDLEKKNSRGQTGITELRNVFDAQTDESLKNTVSFISELRGIKYLMDVVKGDTRAEIVVINATAIEFTEWLVRDNLEPGVRRRLLQSAFLPNGRIESAAPGLIYLTDSAFHAESDNNNKEAWLKNLASRPLQNGGLRMLLPPICLSTGTQDSKWDSEGETLAEIASGNDGSAVPAPVMIVGPSPYLNPAGDVFGTYLPAGYLFAAHFLCQPDQRVANLAVVPTEKGRFRVVGSGIGQMRKTLDRSLWSGGGDDNYAFAADFYLYILLTVLATATNNVGAAGAVPTANSYFPFFTGRETPGSSAYRDYATSAALDPALIGTYLNFSFERRTPENPRPDLHLFYPEDSNSEIKIRDMRWFYAALSKAGLPY